jgi:ribose-phosphate pyrophosphokinase
MQNHFKLFALSGSLALGEAIAKQLNLPLNQVERTKFADGELLIKPLETVRNHHVYIVQSTSKPATENLMELLIFVDALRRSSAKEITVVMPYFGFARQDRVARSREPITARLVADLLVAAGVDHIMTVDIHTMQIQGFFKIPFDNISPYNLFAKEIKRRIQPSDDLVIISPDHGSVTRARNFAELFKNATIGIVDKRRSRPNVAEAMHLIGDVDQKVAVLIDDIVDTGNTILGAVNLIRQAGAKKVFICATHGVFSKDALARIEAADIEAFFVTDTIPQQPSPKLIPISVAPLLAKVIEHTHEGKPLSPIFDEFLGQ